MHIYRNETLSQWVSKNIFLKFRSKYWKTRNNIFFECAPWSLAERKKERKNNLKKEEGKNKKTSWKLGDHPGLCTIIMHQFCEDLESHIVVVKTSQNLNFMLAIYPWITCFGLYSSSLDFFPISVLISKNLLKSLRIQMIWYS